jgi:hypothetical protein
VSVQEVVMMMPQFRVVIERKSDIWRPFPPSVAHLAGRGVETDG